MSAGSAENQRSVVYSQPTSEPTTRDEKRPAKPRDAGVPLSSLVSQVLEATEAGPSPAAQSLERFLTAENPVQALEAWFQTSVKNLDGEAISRTLNRDIARIDAILTKQVNVILHHERFQQLEASWRGLHYLVSQAGTHEHAHIKIRVLNLPWKELARDMERAIEFDQSQLFRKIYNDEFGTAGGEPFGMLIGDYQLTHRPAPGHPTNDIDVLQAVSQVAAAAFCPFITAADPAFLGLDSFTELELPLNMSRTFEQLEYLKWKSFRESEDARFVGLALPQVLMRRPYEDGDGHSDGFRFKEDVEKPDRSQYLWGNAAFAFGEVTMRAFAECGWLADIRGFQRGKLSGGVVGGLAVDSFDTDKDGVALKFVTDGVVTDASEKELGDLGFIPLCQAKDTEFAAFYSNQSAQKPKTYDTPEATVNARISSMLQYMLCVSRFAHYLKVIGRDKVGTLAEARDLEDFLHRWLQKYVTSDADAPLEVKAEYPLREASVQVRDKPGKPGCYQCVMHLRPHFQLDDLSAAVKLTTELAPRSAG